MSDTDEFTVVEADDFKDVEKREGEGGLEGEDDDERADDDDDEVRDGKEGDELESEDRPEDDDRAGYELRDDDLEFRDEDDLELEDDDDLGDDDLDDDGVSDDDLEDEDDELDPGEADDEDELELELVVLDMAGTTVIDDGLVERAFARAADESGLGSTPEEREAALDYVRATMGQSKISVFRDLSQDEDQAQHANAAFEAAYAEFVETEGVAPVPGAERAIRVMRDAGLKVVLTTGFAKPTQDKLIAALGWENIADAVLAPSDAGRGRPFPDLPLTALLRTEASSVASMVVVGDTVSDIESGLAAGAALVVGVLTGAHDENALNDAGADVVLPSVALLPELLGLDD